MAAMSQSLGAARVAIVSGKGGVGKTTVAVALAKAAAESGRRVLLAEVEARNAFAPLLGLTELHYAETEVAPNLTAMSVEADEALVEYLQLFYGIPRLSRALVHSKIVDFATSTAPGLRDILLIGKIKEAEQRREDGRYVYDLIILDAPPTGRLPRILDAPRAVGELVRGGPIRQQAQGVIDMVFDPKRTQVILVTHPEEMPVRETVESADIFRAMGIALGPIVVNAVWPEVRALGRDPAATLREAAAGMDLSDEAIRGLAEVATAHARRARNQRKAISALAAETDLARVELPYVFSDHIGKNEIATLSGLLGAHL
ncbi:MAG: ArsA-related P-loop ATPase [Actinomycetota bacterium]